MKKILFLLFIIPKIITAQPGIDIPKEIVGDDKITKTETASFKDCDFSMLWLDTTYNQNILGIIGKEHQRIKVKFLTVQKDVNNPLTYVVTGKTSVMGNVCDFTGTILLSNMYFLNSQTNSEKETHETNYRGILVADYLFMEDSTQFHVGIFSGVTYSRWKSSDLKRMELDMESKTGNFLNNAFVGNWTSYNGKDIRVCNWGLLRVPESNEDFDIGSGEFTPSDKYHKFGWKSYFKAFIQKDPKAIKEEQYEWWRR